MENNKIKFYEFKNKTNDSVDLYVYGDIIGGSYKWDNTDVTITDFKEQLDNLGNAKTLNMYINSCGGDVFTTQAMIAMLQRCKDNGVTVNATIDGIGCSCASWLPMVADNIYIYPTSIMMVHKPLCIVYGNANDMQEQINILDKIENSVLIPLYLTKATNNLDEEKLKNLLSEETWLNANEIATYFNVTILDENKEFVAYAGENNFLNKYKNTPKNILDKLKPIQEIQDTKEQNIEDKIEDSIDDIDIELLNIELDLLKK